MNESLVMTSPESIRLVLRTHWQGGVRSCVRQLPELILAREVAAIVYKILSGSTCVNQEILGDDVLSKKEF